MFTHTKDAFVTVDLILRPHRLARIVGELHGRTSIGADGFANEAEGREAVIRHKSTEIVGQHSAPTKGDANLRRETFVKLDNFVDVQTVRENDQFLDYFKSKTVSEIEAIKRAVLLRNEIRN